MYTFCPALMSHLMANSDGGIEQINDERRKCVAALGRGAYLAVGRALPGTVHWRLHRAEGLTLR